MKIKVITCFSLMLAGFAASSQVVTLDYFFNREFRKSNTGQPEQFHYTWEDTAQTGYLVWGNIFRSLGAETRSLPVAPTAANLKGSAVYIIVDPDTEKETGQPNYLLPVHIKVIADWVKAGGVLLLLANDSANTELKHFNDLAGSFGLHFNYDVRNKVKGNDFNMGALNVPSGHPIFNTAKKLYIKDICTIGISGRAKSVFTDKNEVVMATAKFGKGIVFAVGDPWFYNEYCNGRLTPDFDNYKAAKDLVAWALIQASVEKK
jgi:unsaturated rhamnogalacturonyl hydrolase